MNANTKNKTLQLEVLERDISALHQPITLLNILAGRTDIEALEPCEIQDALKGIEDLLLAHLEIITNRVATMGGNDETY
ncbi:hypothetical protein [Gallibacterium anatis]|uniref:Uncharacterized protein n=1 Tax=Gallibacterium anatis TaxID=750 RepID=A0A0A2XCY8_9PAST|nr:hypothetical protein [Gallibacterium anatis]KGQ30221.1 hypothetical protein JP32_09260 [Gallibacterium anatis]